MNTRMITHSLVWSSLAEKKAQPPTIAARVAQKPALLPEVFAGLDERKARIKFGCAKVLLHVSEVDPKLLLPYWNELILQLENENKILKWSAMLILGNVASAAAVSSVQALLP